jgi:hypothetical protein
MDLQELNDARFGDANRTARAKLRTGCRPCRVSGGSAPRAIETPPHANPGVVGARRPVGSNLLWAGRRGTRTEFEVSGICALPADRIPLLSSATELAQLGADEGNKPLP